jgi:hypothetical protein
MVLSMSYKGAVGRCLHREILLGLKDGRIVSKVIKLLSYFKIKLL